MKPRKGPVVCVTCGKSIAFNAPTVFDKGGVHRFVAGLPRHLVDTKQVDLNKLSLDYQRGCFSLKEYMLFYVGLGYSIDGFYEVFPKVTVLPLSEGERISG